MSQNEILAFLKEKRKTTDKYYTIKEIAKKLNIGGQVFMQVNRLYAWGYLDIKVEYWPVVRRFRYKNG